ncbi:hypothetical protein [Sphingobacterium sp.]|uniref:hypothetical protein n=1 Tax=Sphingobacterium sp. TaxID=341027 RepID=UPI00289CDA4B|nr:hypothetical protein [Sphingobacterium sp.]
MRTLVKTFAAAALIAVSTFAMAAEGPEAKATKANVNLSTADFALAHYVAVTTEGGSAGVEQLFVVYRRTQLYFGDRYRLIGYIVDRKFQSFGIC